MITVEDDEHKIKIEIEPFHIRQPEGKISLLSQEEQAQEDLDWIFRKLDFYRTISQVDDGEGLGFDFLIDETKQVITISGDLVCSIDLLAQTDCISKETQEKLKTALKQSFCDMKKILEIYQPHFGEMQEIGKRSTPGLF